MRTCRRITFEGEWIPVEVPSDARCAAMRKLKNHLGDHEAHTAASSMLLKRKKVGLSIMSMPVKIIIRPILGKKKRKNGFCLGQGSLGRNKCAYLQLLVAPA